MSKTRSEVDPDASLIPKHRTSTGKWEIRQEPSVLTRAVVVAALLALYATAAAAQTLSTLQGARVNRLDANRFEVIPRIPGASGYAYWCAAARYVVFELGQAWTTDITIARGRSRSETAKGRRTVIFTVDPSAAGIVATRTSQINELSVGQTMNAQSGTGVCHHARRGASR